MAKREFAHPNEMPKYVGQEIGVSDWVEVTQDRINKFADATGDHQWIHTDPERAGRVELDLEETACRVVESEGLAARAVRRLVRQDFFWCSPRF